MMDPITYGRHARVVLPNVTWLPWPGRVFPNLPVGDVSTLVVVPEVVNPGRSAHAVDEES